MENGGKNVKTQKLESTTKKPPREQGESSPKDKKHTLRDCRVSKKDYPQN